MASIFPYRLGKFQANHAYTRRLNTVLGILVSKNFKPIKSTINGHVAFATQHRDIVSSIVSCVAILMMPICGSCIASLAFVWKPVKSSGAASLRAIHSGIALPVVLIFAPIVWIYPRWHNTHYAARYYINQFENGDPQSFASDNKPSERASFGFWCGKSLCDLQVGQNPRTSHKSELLRPRI